MNAQEYAALQAAISAAAAAWAAQVASMFAQAALSVAEWVRLLEVIYPTVEGYRRQSAELARNFYDSQREQFHPELPRHDQYTEDYRFDWFVQSMEPVRKRFSASEVPQNVQAEFTFQVVREVENAGRRQIIHAVETDEPVTAKVLEFKKRTKDQPWIRAGETRPVQGWARVATGRETCGWCLMLVSRGPVYPSAKAGGSKYDSETSIDVIAGNADLTIDEMMNQWHPGCDCKVVPVFDEKNWAGYDAWKRAEQLWNDAHDDAKDWREQNPGRVHKAGKNKGKKIQFYEDQLLALRRRVEGGLIKPQEWAALQAA